MKGCRPLTADETDDVAAAFAGTNARRDRALFTLGFTTGFRVSELLSLRLADVVEAGEIVDRVSVRRRHMKRQVEGRSVALNPKAKDALAAWLRELHDRGYMAGDDYVFQSRKGDNAPLTRVQAYRVLKAAYAAAGARGKTGTHSMRKTFAARVYDYVDHDLVKTQRALGHRNINSTVSYVSFADADVDAAVMAI